VEKTTPDDWARKNRVYPASSGMPGPRDPALTPYMVPFTRAFDPASQYEMYGQTFDTVIGVTSSQMGKTDALLDVIGATMEQRPAPIMYAGPTKEWLNAEVEPRLNAMLTQAPRLRERLATGKRNTRFKKLVGGVPIRLAWAGSASQLAGMAAKLAIMDELDRIAENVKGEGDPFGLLEARGYSFRDRIRAAISTPLMGTVDTERDDETRLEFWKKMESEDVSSSIWRLWQSGTRHHFAWPCPECDEFFIPRFKQLRWKGYPELPSAAEAKRSAFIECPCCGGVIEEKHKRGMNARGVYVAPGQKVEGDVAVGPLPDTTILSYWASGLCSPFVTFGERASSYVAAKLEGKQDTIQSVINTGFGECYAPGSGDVPEWQEVAALRQEYKSTDVPAGVRVVTLAVDVQKNRLVYVVRGWGAGGTSWRLEAGELFGLTHEALVWDQLADLVVRPIGEHVIHRVFIDSGFRPGKPYSLPINKVYEFCRRFPRRVYPTKGRATQDKPLILSKNDVNAKGEVKKYGLDLLWLDTDYCKSWVHERIRWPVDKPGAWYLPSDTTDDYCKQIVAEARVKKPGGTPEWVARSRENHFLDCEALQAALAHLLNVHLIAAPAPVEAAAPAARSSTPNNPAPAAEPAAEKTSAEDRRARAAALGARMANRG
jgi:phage terminase large subunit GpA-like protein